MEPNILTGSKDYDRGFPGGSAVKNLPAMQETWIQSLSWEDPLEKGMETHSRILTWKIPQTAEPGRLQSMESQRAGHNWADNHFKKVQINYLANCSKLKYNQ